MRDRRRWPGEETDAWLSARDDRVENPPVPSEPAPSEQGYTDDEEAEVRKRLEDLGYVE